MAIKSICIVGGGSAGWISTLALARALPNTEIVTVEPTDIETIGVGEATQASITRFFKEYLGLEEREWMPACNATYKLGLSFKNFRTSSPKDETYHVFNNLSSYTNIYDIKITNMVNSGKNIPSNSNEKAFHYCKHNTIDIDEYQSYAYHMDAAEFGSYCKKKCENLINVRILRDKVVQVSKGDNGDINEIELANGDSISADLFIDCTGFASILTREINKEKFIPEKDLPNDRAVVCRMPYLNEKDKETNLNVYTECFALSAGWVWKVPLWDRIGTGYVYSSHHTSSDSAIEEFKAHLSKVYGHERTAAIQFKTIKTRTGRQPSPWYNNCISIGLSSQFLEPLESTGLVFIAVQLKTLIEGLKIQKGSISRVHRTLYNKHLEDSYEELKAFLLLHYINNKREDSSYWRDLREILLSKKYMNMLLEVQNNNNWEGTKNTIFWKDSWEQILVEFDIIDVYKNLNINNTLIKDVEYEVLKALSDDVTSTIESYSLEARRSLSHYQYLKENLYG